MSDIEKMKNKYTSLELSRKLAEAECRLLGDQAWYMYAGVTSLDSTKLDHPAKLDTRVVRYTAYDILNDICCKYAEDFFGHDVLTNRMMKKPFGEEAFIARPKYILELMQQGQKELAEEYIWEHCLFRNKKQKEKS